MATWLYQMNQKTWTPRRYRIEIWEGQPWQWQVNRMVGHDEIPTAGDTVAFFYAPSSGLEPGFYGWAVVMEWLPDTSEMTFRPAAPSDHLKMHPWWDDEAQKLADDIRGRVKQATLWYIEDQNTRQLRDGLRHWLCGSHD